MRLHQITCGHLKNDDDTITRNKKQSYIFFIRSIRRSRRQSDYLGPQCVYDINRIVKAISLKYGDDSIVQYYGAIAAEQRQKNI